MTIEMEGYDLQTFQASPAMTGKGNFPQISAIVWEEDRQIAFSTNLRYRLGGGQAICHKARPSFGRKRILNQFQPLMSINLPKLKRRGSWSLTGILWGN